MNTQLYSAREKNDLAQLIKVMIAYNVTYRQERTPEGQYTYVLDPYVYFFLHATLFELYGVVIFLNSVTSKRSKYTRLLII